MDRSHIDEVVRAAHERKRADLHRIDRAPCLCTTYPFPHRPGGGACPNAGWCPNDYTPLENRVVAWARHPDEEHVEEGVCPQCGWRTG